MGVGITDEYGWERNFYLQRMNEKQRMSIILPLNHFAESLEA
jgi:hypothetical protein